MKYRNSKTPVSQMGGAVVMHDKMYDYGLDSIIRECLGERVKQAKYGHDDIILSWFLTLFCSGFRLIKIKETESDLSMIPALNNFCSHDTLGRALKGFATETKTVNYTNPKNKKDGEKVYKINENEELNDLLILVSKRMGLLKPNKGYTLDIDATPIESEVYDAQSTYKGYRGFMPMVCTIGKVCVYISMRSGNANPHYRKLDCLKKCLETLKKHNIKINRVRIDGAGYKNEVLEYLDSKNIKFVVGANYSPTTQQISLTSKDWTQRKFETSKHVWNAQLGSFEYKLKKGKKPFRMVVIRVKEEKRGHAANLENSPTKWKLKNGYYYKFVITNDYCHNPYDLFKEYHERGAFERHFDNLKNCFGWRILPFSKMNENLVYMLLTATACNVYDGLLIKLAKKVKQLAVTFRLEKFREIFLSSSVRIVKGVNVFYNKYKIDFEKI